jgi:hypothetical protein
MTVALSSPRASSPGPLRDPQVVSGRVEDLEVLQAPRAVPEVLRERPSRRDNPIALSNDIVDLEHPLYPGRRQPAGTGIRDCPSWRPDAHIALLQRDIPAWLVVLIGSAARKKDTGAEADDDVKTVREDLEPHRHPRHWMMTSDLYPAQQYPTPDHGTLPVAAFLARCEVAATGGGLVIRYLDRADLTRIRRAAGRPKDLRRAAELELLA